MKAQSFLKTLLTILVSAFFLTLAVWNFDAGEFVSAIRRMNPLYFLPAFGCYLISLLFRTLRWKIMLGTVKSIGLRPLFSYIVIGYMANNLLPARLGEIVRAYVTGKRERMSRSSAFASVVLERLFDGITIVVILLLLMFIADVDRGWLRYMAWVSSSLFFGGLCFLFVLVYKRDAALSLAAAAARYLPKRIGSKVLHILSRFVDGLKLLHSPCDFAVSLLLSFPVWMAEVAVYIIYLKAFGIEVPYKAALLALVVVNLSSLIPSSPAYIGVFQYACRISLAVFGVAGSVALAWSITLHATQVIPVTLLGLFFLSKFGLSIGEIRRVELAGEVEGDGAPGEPPDPKPTCQ